MHVCSPLVPNALRKQLPDHRYVARLLSVTGGGPGGALLQASGVVQEEVLGLRHQFVHEYGRHLMLERGMACPLTTRSGPLSTS